MNETSQTPEPLDSRDPDAWSECPQGELGGLGKRLRASQRRDRLSQGLGVVGVACVAALAIAFWPVENDRTPAPPTGLAFGGITCEECAEMMPEYHNHLTADGEFASRDAEMMATHLAKCDKCRGYFESTYPGVLAAASAFAWLLLTGPVRAHRARG